MPRVVLGMAASDVPRDLGAIIGLGFVKVLDTLDFRAAHRNSGEVPNFEPRRPSLSRSPILYFIHPARR